jgi:hypothetical protein
MSRSSRIVRAGLIVAAAAGTFALSHAALAKVTKFTITTKQSPAYNGQSFGDAGQYERLIGTVTGELDPADPHNSIITDIALAKRNANGKVEYTTSFLIVKPIDMSRSSGLMWHDVPNRGGRIDIGGQANGDIGLSSAWQGDNSGNTVPGANNEWLTVPIAVNADGTPITGKVMGRIMNASGAASQPMIVHSNPVPYKPQSLDTTRATMVTRTAETIDGVVSGEKILGSTEWAFARCTAANPFPGTPDPAHICIKGGFDPALLYQVVFTAQDPPVLGIGFAAFRDVASFLRFESQDASGNANPLATGSRVKWVITRGVSQSGNYLRAMLHLGFFQDEANRKVYDGMWPIIAGRRVSLNQRFAMPDGVLKLYEPGSEGPQWWSPAPDTVRGLPTAGILDRCTASNTCPKVIEHFGAAEVWGLKLTPEWVGTSATADLPLPPNVRRYYMASTQHGGGGGGFSTTPGNVPSCPSTGYGVGTFAANPVPHTESQNAIRAMFRNWVMNDAPPPPSRYPTIASGNLVEATKAAMGFPNIPGVPATAPTGLIQPVLDYDFGSRFNYTDGSGIVDNVPPTVKRAIKMLAPRVDADGNEIGGVPLVLRDAPLGTYLGWNITKGGFHDGKICNYAGGMIPFAATKAAREANNDPRLSLEERYGNHDGYVAAVMAAASNALNQGFLLPEDAIKLVNQAKTSDVLTPSTTVGVVEFIHALTEQYFMTSTPAEAASLDGTGAGGGWARTGEMFRAWRNDTSAPADTVPVCRLVGKSGSTRSDHMFSSNAAECTTLKNDATWTYEGDVFRVRPVVNGGCPAGHELVTRLVKAASSVGEQRHRWITDTSLLTPLVAAGWKVEGAVWCGGPA